MKTFKIAAIAMGLSASMLSVSAHADSFDAMAADRYNSALSGDNIIKVVAVKTQMDVVQTQSFQPFASNRYNPALFSAISTTETTYNSDVTSRDGQGFNPLSAKRYHM